MKSFATSICPIKKSSRSEYEALGGSPAWRTFTQPVSKRFLSGVITGLRHGDLAYRCFRAISAWRSSHLSALRHGDPAQRCLRGIPTWQTIPQPISKRFLSGVITGLRHGNQLTGASEPSPRGEAVIYRPFGTATLPRGVSEASPRGRPSPNRSQNGFFPVS